MWLARGELRRVPYKNEQMSMLLSCSFARKTLWSVFEKNCKIHNSAMKQQSIRAIGAKMRGVGAGTRKNIRINRCRYQPIGVGMGMGRTCKIFKKAIKL